MKRQSIPSATIAFIQIILFCTFNLPFIHAGDLSIFEKTYIRDTQKPQVTVDTFEMKSLSGEFLLTVQNGKNGDFRVSAALIWINGQQVIDTSLFNNQVDMITLPVPLGLTNEIWVELRGKPGDFISFNISGTDMNTTPVADAGPEQTLHVGKTVTLDGTQSSDVDGDSLSFFWSFASQPADSKAVLTSPNDVNPTFIPDLTGNYIVRLIVNDGLVDSAPDTVSIFATNTTPVADAGSNQTIGLGTKVILDGSISSDIDGDLLTFNWSLLSVPFGSTAFLSDFFAVTPDFTADKPGTYVVQLIVNDGLVSSAPDSITITTKNTVPVANAGLNQAGAVGTSIILDGSASSDADGDSLTYHWVLTTRPPDSNAALSETSVVDPSFVIDKPGIYIFQLVVNDEAVDSPPDMVTVTTVNLPPVANAGADKSVFVDDTVSLDGSGSRDADGDALTYSWTIIEKPTGSAAVLFEVNIVSPQFMPDISGRYVIQLTVNDGHVDSSPDSTTVTTSNRKPVAEAGSNKFVVMGESVTLDGSASSDPDNDLLIYNWSITESPVGSSASFNDPHSVTPSFVPDMAGNYTISLIVNDGTSDSNPDFVQIATANQSPVFVDLGPQEINENDKLKFQILAEDPEQDTLIYSAPNLPTGASLNGNTGEFFWTPTFDQQGEYPVTFSVTDGPNTAEMILTIIVFDVNRKPVAVITGSVVGATAQNVELNGSDSSDSDNDPLTYSWTISSKPSGSAATLSYLTAAMTSFIPDWIGTYEIELVVNDGNLNSPAAAHSIAVAGSWPPIITSSPVTTAQIDEIYIYNLTAHDPDSGDKLTYLLEAAPTGMSIDQETGAITWLPTESQSGGHQVIVLVEDLAGLNVRQTFNLMVSDGGECGVGAINVCGRCVPFTPPIVQTNHELFDEEIKAVQTKLDSIDLPFVTNQGQEDTRVEYYTATAAGNIYVTSDGKLVYSLRPSENESKTGTANPGWTLTETFVNGKPTVIGEEIATTKVSYFKGKDTKSWQKEIPTYSVVGLGEVWPGITMRLKAHSNSVEKIFTVLPQASVDAIQLRLDGVEALNLTKDGYLQVQTGIGDVILTQPVAWQEIDGQQEPIMVAYNVTGDNSYGFTLGSYDPTVPVMIDPLLQATFIGSNQSGEWGSSIAVHPTTREVYVAGATWSANFPGTEGGAQDTSMADASHADLFIVRLSEDLSTLLQATYLGGSGQENWLPQIMIHPLTGEIYVSGITQSNDLPGTEAGAQSFYGGGTDDAFVARLNTNLTSLLQATYIGGSGYEGYWSPVTRSVMAVHPISGDVYLAGLTSSADFPSTEGAAQASPGKTTTTAGQDGFIVRITASLQSIIQSSYLGGLLNESIQAIVIHPVSGDILAAGVTHSNDLPGTSGGHKEILSGFQDGFVACLNEDLTELLQSTYVGSDDPSLSVNKEEFFSLTIHPFSGDLYLGGYTMSREYPGTAGGAVPALDPDIAPVPTGILVRMSPDMASVRQATYLSGPAGGSYAYDVKVHPASGAIYVAGTASGLTFPGVEGGTQIGRCGWGHEGFIAKLSEDLTQLFQATYVGGGDQDEIHSFSIHPITGDLYLAGTTLSNIIPGTQGGAWEFDPAPHFPSAFAVKLTADLQGDPFNEPPEIVPNPMPEILVGESLNYQVEVSDPNTHDCVEYWPGEKPDGLMIDRETGIITYTPSHYAYQGDHTVEVHIMDGGGLEDTHSFTLTVVQPPTAPTFYSTPVTTATAGESYYYRASARDSNYDYLTYSLDVAPTGMTADSSGRLRWTPSEGDVGVHEVVVRATDPGGLFDTQQFFLTVNLPNHAPSITSSPVTSAIVGEPYTYDVEAVDPDVGDLLRYAFTLKAVGMIINADSGLIQWIPSEAQTGDHEITVQAIDSGNLTATQSFTINVMLGNRPPAITSFPLTSATEDSMYIYDVEAIDPDTGDTLTYVLDPAPEGMTIVATTGLIQWMPGNGDVGSHAVTVIAHDDELLYDSQSFTVAVANVNDAPVITSLPVKEVIEGSLYEYQVEVTDQDSGDTLTYSLSKAPTGMSMDASGLVQWSPGEGLVGYYEVSVRVQDGGELFDTQSYKLTVVDANHPPVITSTAVTSSMEGELYVYDVEASDTDATDTLTFSLIASPEGMTVEEVTGLINWTPTFDQAGAHPVMVGVMDNRGLSDVQEFTITVADVPTTSVRIEATPDTMKLPLGAPNSISYVVNLEVTEAGDYTALLTQVISPDDGGLTFELPTTLEWSTLDSTAWLTSQVFVGNAIGTYEVTTEVTILETGTTQQVTNTVEVASGRPVLLPPVSYPDAIPISETVDVLFTTKQNNSRLRPIQIAIEEVDGSQNLIREVGNLFDDGSQGDLAADDLVYSGVFPISAGIEGPITFRVKAIYLDSDEPVYTEMLQLGVTRFPIGMIPPDMSKIVTDPFSEAQFISDEVMVSFAPGTGPSVIESIVDNINGTVIGSLFALGIYQVGILDTGDASGVLSAIAQLSSYPEVQEVEPNGILELAEATPNDSYYETHQWGPKKIRANEAWVLTRGGSDLIAVIDTGVDYNHQDLTGKVIQGKDYGDWDYDPMDGDWSKSHGTHVAGIAASHTNNDIGIGGISWNNEILAIKIFQDYNPRTSRSAMFLGTMEAVSLGAKIINFSVYGEDPSPMMHNAIQYSRRHGVLFVACAGNTGSFTTMYPAAYQNAFAVANTTQTDARAGSSTYGLWVDIAAPGTDIFSTVRDGNYNYLTGSSMSVPHVAGVAALMLAQHPGLSVAKLRERMVQTVVPLPGLGIGKGRVDAFGAIFNGSFEATVYPSELTVNDSTVWPEPQIYDAYAMPIPGFNANDWSDRYYYRPNYRPDFPTDMETGWYFLGYEDVTTGSSEKDSVLFNQGGGIITSLGPITPRHGQKMAQLLTGRAGETFDFMNDVVQRYDHPLLYMTFMEKRFRIQPGQTEFSISFYYNFVSEEGPGTYTEGDGFQISIEFDTGDTMLANRVHVLAHGRNQDPDFYSQLVEVTGPPDTRIRFPFGGAPLYGTWELTGNEPVFQTGWQPIMSIIPLPAQMTTEGGMATIRFAVYDTGGAYSAGGVGASTGFGSRMDSSLLVDGIEFK